MKILYGISYLKIPAYGSGVLFRIAMVYVTSFSHLLGISGKKKKKGLIYESLSIILIIVTSEC